MREPAQRAAHTPYTLHRPIMRPAIGVFIICALSLVFIAYEIFTFSSILRDAKSIEHVRIDSVAYTVTAGSVARDDGGIAGPVSTLRALRVALQKVTARRDPLLPLEGTDTAAAAGAISSLIRTQTVLAEEQTDPESKAAIASGFYPIGFLASLVETENARRMFLLSGSEADMRAYLASLQTSLSIGAHDIEAHRSAFAKAVNPNVPPFAEPGGVISRTSMDESMQSTASAFLKLQAAFDRQQNCLRGIAFLCSRDLKLHLNEIPRGASSEAGEQAARTTRMLLSDALDEPSLRSSTMVELLSSACVGSLPVPRIYVKRSDNVPGILFVGDILYSPIAVDTKNNFLKQLAKIGMRSFPYWPTSYYKCADLRSDAGRVTAVLAVRESASRHELSAYLSSEEIPSMRGAEDKIASGDLVREIDVLDYLQKAVAISRERVMPEGYQNALARLVLQFNARSASFEDIVRQINLMEDSAVQLNARGFVSVRSASFVYYGRNPIYQLFQSVGISPIERTDLPEDAPIKLLSALKDEQARQGILHDVTAYTELHKLAP